MNVTKSRAGAFLFILALLLLAACGGGSDKSEPTAPPASDDAPVAATEVVEPTEPPVSGGEEPASGGEEPVAATEAPPEPTAVPAGPEIPYDIAIIDGATNLEIQETLVTYRLEEFQIEDAAEFYKNFMAEQGWDSLTDSTIGVMATLVFESDEARVSIKLQANTFAETVDVQILVFHK